MTAIRRARKLGGTASRIAAPMLADQDQAVMIAVSLLASSRYHGNQPSSRSRLGD